MGVVVAEIATDRTVVMYRGEAVERVRRRRFFADPRRPYTRALLSAVPQLSSIAGTSEAGQVP